MKRKLDLVGGEYENRLIDLQTECNILKNQLDESHESSRRSEKVSAFVFESYTSLRRARNCSMFCMQTKLWHTHTEKGQKSANRKRSIFAAVGSTFNRLAWQLSHTARAQESVSFSLSLWLPVAASLTCYLSSLLRSARLTGRSVRCDESSWLRSSEFSSSMNSTCNRLPHERSATCCAIQLSQRALCLPN